MVIHCQGGRGQLCSYSSRGWWRGCSSRGWCSTWGLRPPDLRLSLHTARVCGSWAAQGQSATTPCKQTENLTNIDLAFIEHAIQCPTCCTPTGESVVYVCPCCPMSPWFEKKKNPCVCSPRSPWFEKKNQTISPD